MASAPPDAGNEGQSESELAAALLLAGRRYDLLAMIRAARVKPRPFRQIRPTEALKSNLAAPHFAIVRAWQAELPALLAIYETGDSTALRLALDSTAARVSAIAGREKLRFADILTGIERWHRAQWISRIRASTTIDVTYLTQPQEVRADVEHAEAWNRSLADDVAAQTHNGIASALFVGLAAAMPVGQARARAAEVIAKARRRAAGIGSDQVDKVSRAMDRSRRTAAGLTSFRWHHTPQRHPRDWHKARDGKVFNSETAPEPFDRAGVPAFCKCWEEPLFH